MGNWDETGNAMGFNVEGQFVSLNEGANEVVTYVDHKRVQCTPKEIQQNFCAPNGETIEYIFTSPVTGKQRILRRSSKGLFYAFKGAKVNPGDTIRIERTGSGPQDTRYNMVVLSPAEVQAHVEEKKRNAPLPDDAPPLTAAPPTDEEIRIEDIPF